jgi:hypothetical protein
MKAIATLKLHIDIDQAKEMGLEIDDPREYAAEEFMEWVYEMVKSNDLYPCIDVTIEGESE